MTVTLTPYDDAYKALRVLYHMFIILLLTCNSLEITAGTSLINITDIRGLSTDPWEFQKILFNKINLQLWYQSRGIISNAFKNKDKRHQIRSPWIRILWSSEIKIRSFFSIRILRQPGKMLLNAKAIRKIADKDMLINFFLLTTNTFNSDFYW